MRVVNVVGARPNLIKIAPLLEAMGQRQAIEPILVHTGQHYDANLSQVFFDELGIPTPDIHLGVGSGSHAEQTARVMLAFEPLVRDLQPDIVLVVGDVNSTLASALTATKMHVPVAHVEAGLRSFDRTMPEEINRIVTDSLSDWLFTTERSANDNLLREGRPAGQIHFVGNVMVDTLLRHRERALLAPIHERLGVVPGKYLLVTLHRPRNVDDRATLEGIAAALIEVNERLPVILPLHPRTRRRLETFGLADRLGSALGARLCEPLGYLEFLHLMARAPAVLTDSGGIQEETTILGTPCLTLRPNTERPITVSVGTNRIIGSRPERIVPEVERILAGDLPKGQVPELWDGRAAERIVEALVAGRDEVA